MFPTGWTWKIPITVIKEKVGENLSEFPVYLDLSELGDDFWNEAKADGSDIVATTQADQTTKLNRELKNFNVGSKIGQLYFNAPTLSVSSNSPFYIHFGNPDGAEVNSTLTWNNAHVLVAHHEELSGVIYDSSQSELVSASQNPTYNQTGKVGKAFGCPQTGYAMNSAIGSVLDLTNVGTLSCIIKRVSIDHWEDIIYRDSTYALRIQSNNVLVLYKQGGNYNNCPGNTPITSTVNFYHIAATFDNGAWKVILNGIEDGSATKDNFPSNANQVSVGYGGGQPTNLIIDEIRISNTPRSVPWLLTESNNLLSPSTFYSIGPREAEGEAEASPDLINYYAYSAYNSFVGQFLNHRAQGTTPWKLPDGTLWP